MINMQRFINRTALIGLLGLSLLTLGVLRETGSASAQGACSALPTTYGKITHSLPASSSTQRDYWAWARIKSADGNPSFVLSLQSDQDSQCSQTLSKSGAGNNTWVWVRTAETITWAGGNLNIEAAGNKSDVGLDCIVLHSSASFNPSSASDCTQSGGTNDTTKPTISILSPGQGVIVSGPTDITATADDDVGVTNVVFAVDGSQIGTDASSPYSVNWNSTTLANGNHTIEATASDAAGNTESATVTVNVQNGQSSNQPPSTVTNFNASASGTSAQLSWTAATDPDGDSVQYRVERRVTGSFETVATVSSPSHTDTGLQANTTYTYRIVTIETNRSPALSSAVSETKQITTSGSCQTVTIVVLLDAISSYKNATVNTRSTVFNTNGDQRIDITELLAVLSAYKNQSCI